MEKQVERQTIASLPLQDYQDIFRNLNKAKRFAIDIGGSLTKIAYFSTVSHRRVSIRVKDKTNFSTALSSSSSASSTSASSNINQSSSDNDSEFEYENCENARLHFIKFETRLIENCLEFIRTHLVGEIKKDQKTIKATGGGSQKYKQLIEEKLGLTVDKEDEMHCLIKGSNFLLKHVADEAFTFDRTQKGNEQYKFQPPGPITFPYLLVNIGSGVSVLKVDGEEDFERIGGTSTGGGTFWGLGALLTGSRNFDDLLLLAEKGDHKRVDMLVKDIYAGDLRKIGLEEDTIASSFGKCIFSDSFEKADLARSLLFTIVNDIGQIASLYAMKHSLKKIYFGGYFLRGHSLSMHAISYSVKYWSKNTVEPCFLRHEGYLGSIGAFLQGAEEDEVENNSWGENLFGSSGLSNDHFNLSSSIKPMEHLEIDKLPPVGFFPLLHSPYYPDTIDLSEDLEARDYWLTCFETWIGNIPTRAIQSQPDQPAALDRALRCRQKLLSRYHLLKSHPHAYGRLSVRILLDTIEQTLKEYDFPDPFLVQKQIENGVALSEFENRIKFLDTLEDPILELIEGVLAGNFFDWGAKEISKILEGPDTFGFTEAKARLLPRPWLVDCVDDWIIRMKKKPYRCVTVFVDNSGYDFLLGIIPFVRYFLQRGTKVILVSNSSPALNDMTYKEMCPLLRQIPCPVIQSALEKHTLIPMQNGQGSPCLDLSRVSHDLSQLVVEEQVDLVVIEGMGRAIHTNLNAKFKCDVLKCAVIKNKWLGEHLFLSSQIFSIIFKFEQVQNDGQNKE